MTLEPSIPRLPHYLRRNFVSNEPPASNEVYVWDDTAKKWRPTAVVNSFAVKEATVAVGTATAPTLDFGAGFDVTESPADEFNIALDLSEISAGGELGGTMDAPTVDVTHSGSAHHTQSHDHSAAGDGTALAPVTVAATTSVSAGANPAQSGAFRLPSNSGLSSRNAAGDADINIIKLNASNLIEVGNHLVPAGDGGNDFGGSSIRWRGANLSDYVAVGTNPAATGNVRLPNTGAIIGRNAVNNADVEILQVNASNQVQMTNGIAVDTIAEKTAAAGVTIDTLLVKDGLVDGMDPSVMKAIDFLVGTASAELSGEIIVGATPGGELGNTWASPTVDATHSGSAHHDAITIGADAAHSLATQVLSGVAASLTKSAHVELATTAEINTGTDTTRAIPVDQFVASARNVRYILWRVLDAATAHTVLAKVGGDLELPFTGTITEIGAYVDTAGVSAAALGTIDVNLNGATLMTNTKITLDTTEKSSRTAATLPVLTTTAVTAADIITVDIDVLHATTAAKGLTVRLGVRLT